LPKDIPRNRQTNVVHMERQVGHLDNCIVRQNEGIAFERIWKDPIVLAKCFADLALYLYSCHHAGPRTSQRFHWTVWHSCMVPVQRWGQEPIAARQLSQNSPAPSTPRYLPGQEGSRFQVVVVVIRVSPVPSMLTVYTSLPL